MSVTIISPDRTDNNGIVYGEVIVKASVAFGVPAKVFSWVAGTNEEHISTGTRTGGVNLSRPFILPSSTYSFSARSEPSGQGQDTEPNIEVRGDDYEIVNGRPAGKPPILITEVRRSPGWFAVVEVLVWFLTLGLWWGKRRFVVTGVVDGGLMPPPAGVGLVAFRVIDGEPTGTFLVAGGGWAPLTGENWQGVVWLPCAGVTHKIKAFVFDNESAPRGSHSDAAESC